MEQPLVLLLSLSLVSCSAVPDFCHEKLCPQYNLIKKHKDFEERLYPATDWITTKVESTGQLDVMAAHTRLKDYCDRQRAAGYTIPADTWPVLISGAEGQDMWMSWFIPNDTDMPNNNDQYVTQQNKPEATVYVKVYDGSPDLQKGKEKARELWNDLHENCTDIPPYSGAVYDSYFSLHHHNEMWIYANDINCMNAK